MSVVCIDFGSQNTIVAVARTGAIETITNATGHRETPSCVAFTARNRLLGNLAKDQQDTNMKNTIYEFKHLLGKKFDASAVQREADMKTYEITDSGNGQIGIRVDYLNEKSIFTPEQVLAMLFTRLKGDIISDLGSRYSKQDFMTILTVPCYFTSSERHSMLDAAKIAGLNCLQLMNETTANALCYGYYKQNELQRGESRNIFIVDFGHTSIQVCAVTISKGEVKIVATESAMVGGRDFDRALAKHFCDEYKQKFNDDPRNDKEAYLKLLTKMEEVKKQMSKNSKKLAVKFENIMNNIEWITSRADMENICESLIKTAGIVLQNCLSHTGWSSEKIFAVEIVGGSTRIPAVQDIIEKIFQKKPGKSLTDESAAKGGAIFFAMTRQSYAQRIRAVEIVDIHSKALRVELIGDNQQSLYKSVIKQDSKLPIEYAIITSLKFNNLPMKIVINPLDGSENLETYWLDWGGINNDCNIEELTLKAIIQVDDNGIISVTEVRAEVEIEVARDAKKENKNANYERHQDQEDKSRGNIKKTSDNNKNYRSSRNPFVTLKNAVTSQFSGVTKEKVVREVLIKTLNEFSDADLQRHVQLETQMIHSDNAEIARMNARNELDEFVIKMNKIISTSGIRNMVIDRYMCKLDHVESWLSGDGDSESKETFKKLKGQLAGFNVIAMAQEVEKITQSFGVFARNIEAIAGKEIGCDFDNSNSL